MSKSSLSKICILNVAHLLKKYYWSRTLWFEEKNCSENPFSSFPSQIIEEIIAAVLELSPKGTLCEKDLRPVLSSNRVKFFELYDVLIQTKELVAILTLLSNYGEQLTSLVLHKIYCTDYLSHKVTIHSSTTTEPLQRSAVENLLASASNLEYLHTDIPFDLSVLKLNKELKQLEIDFVPRNKLSDIVPEYSNESEINKIRRISICEGPRHTVPKEQIAFLLQHCPDLVWFENSIAEALEFLHAAEYDAGLLTKRYRLERAILGNAFLNPDLAPATSKAVQIASITCPCIAELDLLINSHDAIFALSKMTCLKSLLVQWAHAYPGDFSQGLIVALQSIGFQLNHLNILSFCNIDLAAIATLCPNLTFLKLEVESEMQSYEPPDVCLQSLHTLLIECLGNSGLCENTLTFLLSHCHDLENLCLDNVPCFTDSLLKKILVKNSLSEVVVMTLLGCSLTAEGLKQLVISCKSLQFLDVCSSAFSREEASQIVQEINPSIIMRHYEG